MNVISYLLLAGLTFGACFLIDKGYAKLFRNKQQHRSGLSVRVSKRYATFGLILCILSILAFFASVTAGKVLLIGGVLVLIIGGSLIAYYMSFGIFYDADSFIQTALGKKEKVYRFCDIRHQQLYTIQGGSFLIELHMADGSAVSVSTAMEGAYPFLDHAFAAWCRQTGRDPQTCAFHDPAAHLWFPMEVDA